MNSKKLAFRVVAAAKSKKAQKVLVLDMQKVSNLCDYFVILSGTSLRHINAIAQGIVEELLADKIKALSKVNPSDESGWIVLDFSSVVVHLFYTPMREFYALERLWSDAKKVRAPAK